MRLYILTIAVLAPYRGLGVGARLLRAALDACAALPEVTEAYLHVQVCFNLLCRLCYMHQPSAPPLGDWYQKRTQK